MYFYYWTDIFFYSDSESNLNKKICHNFYALNQTVIIISFKETVSSSEEKWLKNSFCLLLALYSLHIFRMKRQKVRCESFLTLSFSLDIVKLL